MEQKQYWLGLPKHLFWGFIAIAIFMSGDGFEMAFLSKHITDLGLHRRNPLWYLRYMA